jgi:hypothetical protein
MVPARYQSGKGLSDCPKSGIKPKDCAVRPALAACSSSGFSQGEYSLCVSRVGTLPNQGNRFFVGTAGAAPESQVI